MKIKSLLMILIGLIQINLLAQTNVGGTLTSNATWTIDGSPYNLTSTVGIPTGVTLTIEPGVEITGEVTTDEWGNETYFDILVKGQLIANGKNDSIIQLLESRIIFKSSNLSNSEISFISFINSGVQLADEAEHNQDNVKNTGTLTVENCEFGENSYARTKGYDANAYLIINNSLFYNAEIKGYYPRTETITINDCIIENSTILSDSYNKGIFINESNISNTEIKMGCCGANFAFSSSTINNSITYGCCGSPVSGDYEILNSTFYNSPVSLPSARLTITNSIIINEGNLSISTYDLEEESNTNAPSIKMGNGTIENSKFIGNVITNSLYITGYSGYNVGGSSIISNSVFSNDYDAIIVEDFYSFEIDTCNFYNIDNYILKNISANDISAQSNWWGTTSSTEISEKIYDMYDDINAGQVDYSNFLLSPTTSAPISAPVNVYKYSYDNGVKVIWDSNQESDASGYKIYYKSPNSNIYENLIDAGSDTSYFIDGITLSNIIVITAYDNEADSINDLFEGHESLYSSPAEIYFSSYLLSGLTYCEGDEIQYQIDINAIFKSNNNFIIQLSDTSGSFDNPINLIELDTSTSLILSTSFPDTLIYGKEYIIRVKSTNPEAYSVYDTIVFYQIPISTFTLDTNKLCNSDTLSISYLGTGTAEGIYNWNFNNGNIISGSGRGDYQVNWSSSGSKIISLSVTENGCTSDLTSDIIKVYQPTSNFTVDNYVCDNQSATVYFNGNATDSAEFNWEFNDANIISGSDDGPFVLNWDEYGSKEISLLINDNGCQSITTNQIIEHNSKPLIPSIYAPTNVCYNSIANIDYSGSFSSTANYNWDFNSASIISGSGIGPYDVKWSNSGTKTISLNVIDNGCSSDTTIYLAINPQTQPISICMVSVDNSNHNMVIWEQLSNNPYDSIIIYKETSQTNVYEKIGSHPADESSVYIDENSNSAQNSSRYKIAVLDTCGYETSQSDYHKTIHLTISIGIGGTWNLIWDGYEGFNYSTYNIYRGTSDDELLKIAEQASNTFTFTDLTPPVGTVYYQIEVENPNSCIVSNLKSTNSSYNSTRSNIVNSNQATSINDIELSNITIWPNPANNKLYVKANIVNENISISILSLEGKELLRKQIYNDELEIDISHLNSGMYIIKVENNESNMIRKIIKQ